MNIFETLNKIDVSENIEKKDGLSYLSWAWAWSELKKVYPNAQYTIERFGEEKKPYLYDEKLGYMVFTSMTIEGLTHDMWLPVMDGKNKAMKDHPYKYQTKYGEKTVEAATMFDINKTIMRCLVKNISMFGLGLYIYAGEDLPEGAEEKQETKIVKATPKQVEMIKSLYDEENQNKMLEYYKVLKLEDLSVQQASEAISKKKGK